MTSDSFFSEWSRLAAVPTVAGVLAHDVADLAPVTTVALLEWMQRLPLPAGWQVARFDAGPIQPTRIAVCEPDPNGGVDGCETIGVFRFTGPPPDGGVLAIAEQTLRELGADSITTRRLSFPDPQAIAVRSSGYLNLPGRRSWLQYTVCLVDPQPPAPWVLIEQNILATAASKGRLRDDIIELSNIVQDAVSGITKTVRQAEISPADQSQRSRVATLRVQPYDDMGIASILVNADEGGMRLLRSAVRSAHTDGTSFFDIDGIEHRIIRQGAAAGIELGERMVIWRFDDDNLLEILELIEPLIIFDTPAHNYLDLGPGAVEQIVFSVDEYVGTAPYGEFPQLSQTPPTSE